MTATTPIAYIRFDISNNILHVKIHEGADMNLANAKIHYEKIKLLIGTQDYFALVDASNHYSVQEDAWEYASLPEIVSNRKAVAQYNIALANRLTATFFTANYKTLMPFKIFPNKDEALDWLQSFS